MDISSLACTPIPGEAPAGIEARYEPEYTVMLEEIDKLTSLNRSEICNWQVVCDMGIAILQNKSKDFQVACYTANAMSRLRGFVGMADGAMLLTGLIKTYWETGFPALKRLRRRENAFIWWKDCSEALIRTALEETATNTPYPAQTITGLRQNILELDAELSQVLPDFPSLHQLAELIDRLPVLEDKPQQTAGQDKPQNEAPHEAQSGAQNEAPAESVAQQNTEEKPAEKAEVPVQDAQPASGPEAPVQDTAKEHASAASSTGENKSAPEQPAATATAAATNPAPVQAGMPPLAAPVFASTLSENMTAFKNYALLLADMALKANNTNPFAWQLSRLAMWGRIRQLPPAQGRQTSLPAPPTELREALQLQITTGNYLNAALTAENLFLSNIWWLDIQYLQATALEHCGPDYASVHSAVIGELRIFLNRLPGIQELTFIDGTPFAAYSTRDWLNTIQNSKTTHHKGSPAQKSIAQARKLFLDGQHKSAMDTLDQELIRSNRNLDKLELRLEQCRLLIQGRQWLGATALADELLTFYRKLHLGEWSLNLGMDVLSVARRAWEGFDSEQSKKRLEEIQRQMVLLRPSSAFDDDAPEQPHA